jgi:hypothetical protein
VGIQLKFQYREPLLAVLIGTIRIDSTQLVIAERARLAIRTCEYVEAGQMAGGHVWAGPSSTRLSVSISGRCKKHICGFTASAVTS